MDDILCCKICGRRMMVYSTREQDVSGFRTLLRWRKCTKHDDYRVATLELPKDLATEVLSDD